MNCSDCLELVFDACSDLTFDIGLADGTYWVWLYDQHDNVHKKEVTVLNDSFTLYQTDFPEGLFSSDGFTIYISTSETTNTEEDFTYGYDTYNCVVGSMYNLVSGTNTLAPTCSNNYTAVTDPGLTDDRPNGYCVGSEWLNTLTNTLFKCTDDSTGAAVWMIVAFV